MWQYQSFASLGVPLGLGLADPLPLSRAAGTPVTFFALTSAKMGHTFWARLGFWEGLCYLQFEYFQNLTMAF